MAKPDPDDRELLRHLFAKATALLEDALETALEGQGARLSVRQQLTLTQRLRVRLGHARTVAEALEALVPVRDRRRR